MKVYNINLNPLGANDPVIIANKENSLKACLESYFSSENKKSETEIISFAYSFKKPNDQKKFLELLIDKASNNKSLVIFQSISDVGMGDREVVCRSIERWLEKEIAGLFISSISTKKQFCEYRNEYVDFCFGKKNYTHGRLPYRPSFPKELMEYAIYLKAEEHVLLPDIKKYTGINKTTLMTHISNDTYYENDYKKGRSITDTEIQEIEKIKINVENAILKSVTISYDDPKLIGKRLF